MTAHLHNRVLRAAEKRADLLEPRLVEILTPILERAGRDAARAFRAHVTDHLTADGRRAADREALARDPHAGPLLLAALDVRSNSTMICVKPRPGEAAAIADPDGSPAENLHVTLAYLGELDGDLSPVLDALAAVAGSHAALAGVVGGYGQFGMPDGSRVGILLPDVPGLVELRVAVTEALATADIGYGRDHGFEAHLTVDPDPEDGELERMLPLAGSPLHFDELLVVRGDVEVHPLPLVGPPPLTASAARPFCLPAELRTKTDPVRMALIRTTMTPALEQAGLSFDVGNPLVEKVLAQSGRHIKSIAETTQVDVMRTVRAAYDQGLSIPDTAKAIQAAMTDSAPARAAMIARTELAGAVNGASLAAAQIVSDAEGAAGTLYKQWLTAPGAPHPRHEDYDGLDGQTVNLGDVFQVGDSQMQHPGDPEGEPGEVINCRCTMTYTDDASELTAAAPPRRHVRRPTTGEKLDAVVRHLAASAGDPPGWTPPSPSEILRVDCEGAGAKVAATISSDERQAAVNRMYDRIGEREASDRERETLLALDDPSFNPAMQLRVTTSPTGEVRAAISYEHRGHEVYISHFGALDRGSGKPLIDAVIREARAQGLPVRLTPAPGTEAYYRGLGFVREGDMMRLDPFLRGDTISVGAGPAISRTTLEKIDRLGIDQWPPVRSPLARELLGGASDTVERHQVDGVWTAERKRLHDQIVAAHFEGKAATDTRDAYFTAGGGASGKSHALFVGPDGGEVGLEHLAGRGDVIAVDPDRIKMMLPEYKTLREAGDAAAAQIVHEESSMLGKRIIDEARARGFSMLVDTTGSSGGFTAKLEAAARAGYDVQVTMFSIPTNEAIARSVARGERSGRYVAIQPLKSAHKGASAQLAVWKDSGAVGRWRVYDNSRAPELVAEGVGGRTTVYDQELWDQILAKGRE